MPIFPHPMMFMPGPMPGMPMFQPPMPGVMPAGAVPRAVGGVPSPEVQEHTDRAYLTMQRQQLAQAISAIDEYRKLFEEQLATIDQHLERLSEAARERRDSPVGSQVNA
jgi:hypothetical protein